MYEDQWTGLYPITLPERIQAAGFFLMIWSKDANTPWVRREWATAQSLCLAYERPCLCTLVVGPVELPAWAFGYQSHEHSNLGTLIDLIVQHASTGAPNDGTPPDRPFARESPEKGEPPPASTGFAGMSDRLLTMLTVCPDPVLIYGEPGAGKTYLADWIAKHVPGHDRIIKQECCGRREIDIVAELARELADSRDPGATVARESKGFSALTGLSGHLSGNASDEQIACLKLLVHERKTLIIFDGVESDVIQRLLPGPPALVVCTSRKRRLDFIPASRSLELSGLTSGDAESVFARMLPHDVASRYGRALRDLAARFEYSPAAVVEAAARLRTYGDPREALEELHRFVLPSSFRTWTDACRSVPAGARKLIAAMAVCSVRGASLPFVARIAGLSAAQREELRDLLVDASLLKIVGRERQEFRLHTILYEAEARSSVTSDLRDRHAMALEHDLSLESVAVEKRIGLREVTAAIEWLRQAGASSRLASLLAWGADSVVRLSRTEQEAIHDLELRVGTKRKIVAKIEARLLRRIYFNRSRILQSAGRLAEAGLLLERALSLDRRLADWKGQRDSLGALAAVRSATGETTGAVLLLARQTSICRKHGDRGGEHSSLGKRVLMHLERGEQQKAQKLLRERARLDGGAAAPTGSVDFAGPDGSLTGLWASISNMGGRRSSRSQVPSQKLSPQGDWLGEFQRFWGGSTSAQYKRADILESIGATPGEIQARLETLLAAYRRDAARTALDLRVDWQFAYGVPRTNPKERSASDALLTNPDVPTAVPNFLDRTLKDHAEEALAHLHNREALAKEQRDDQTLAELYGLESRVLCLSGRWDDALDILRQQSPIVMRLGDRFALEENYGRQAIALGKLGNRREATIALDQQTALLGALQFEEDLGYAHWNWGLLAARRADYDTAGVYFGEARALLEGLGRPEEAGELDGEVEGFFGDALRSTITTGLNTTK